MIYGKEKLLPVEYSTAQLKRRMGNQMEALQVISVTIALHPVKLCGPSIYLGQTFDLYFWYTLICL